MSVPWEERPHRGEEVVPLAQQGSTAGWASFLLICVGHISFFSCCISDWKRKWLICVILEWVWGLPPWLTSRLGGSLLPAAQISPNELLSLYPADELLDICRPQLSLQFVHKIPSWNCFQRTVHALRDFTSSGYWLNPMVKLLRQLCIFLHTRLASHAFYTHQPGLKYITCYWENT